MIGYIIRYVRNRRERRRNKKYLCLALQGFCYHETSEDLWDMYRFLKDIPKDKRIYWREVDRKCYFKSLSLILKYHKREMSRFSRNNGALCCLKDNVSEIRSLFECKPMLGDKEYVRTDYERRNDKERETEEKALRGKDKPDTGEQ